MFTQKFARNSSTKKQIVLFAIVAVLTVILLAGCSAQSSTPTAQASADQPTAAATVAGEATAVVGQPATGAEVSFSKDVMPLLKASCASCHGVDRVSRGLDVTTYDTLMAGSTNGAVIVAGDPAASKLITLITSGKMPKRGEKLTPAEVQLISDWVAAGAPNN